MPFKPLPSKARCLFQRAGFLRKMRRTWDDLLPSNYPCSVDNGKGGRESPKGSGKSAPHQENDDATKEFGLSGRRSDSYAVHVRGGQYFTATLLDEASARNQIAGLGSSRSGRSQI